MSCLCGATDCRLCGPAQGYPVRRVWDGEARCYRWGNPEDDEENLEQGDTEL